MIGTNMRECIERAAELREKLAAGSLGLRVTGITIEGRPVVGGMYNLNDTHGIPIEVSLVFFERHGWVPDWRSYFVDATGRGRMKPEKVLRVVERAEADIRGAEHAVKILSRLRLHVPPLPG